MNYKQFIGIDNGQKGGICVLNADGGIQHYIKMPIKDGEVDVIALHEYLYPYVTFSKSLVVVEEPHFAKNFKSGKSMFSNMGAVRTVLDLLRVDYQRINAHRWQKHMIPGTVDSKTRALFKAQQLWTGENFILQKCRKPHDGIIDAALIAEWARRQQANKSK